MDANIIISLLNCFDYDGALSDCLDCQRQLDATDLAAIFLDNMKKAGIADDQDLKDIVDILSKIKNGQRDCFVPYQSVMFLARSIDGVTIDLAKGNSLGNPKLRIGNHPNCDAIRNWFKKNHPFWLAD